MCENELAKIAVDIAYTVHKILGPGLPESVYESAFAYELNERGIIYSRQQEIAVPYKTSKLDKAFRSDIIMEGKWIVEEMTLPLSKKLCWINGKRLPAKPF